MKKLLAVLGTLVFAIAVLSASVIRSTNSARPSLAAAKLKFTVSPSPAATPSVTKIDYYLVYPGMLPDHALYKLKMVRDRLALWLAINPLKKTELLLLYADKRLGAGKALIEGNQINLGVSTVVKGEKYLEKAISQALVLKQEGKELGQLSDKLEKAILKHEEVLQDLKEKIFPEGQAILDDLLKLIETLQERVKTL